MTEEVNKGGRPTKLTPKVHDDIVKMVETGNYLETASAYAGINKSTLYDWLRRGEREKARVEKDARFRVKKSEQIYVDFSDAIEQALARAEVRDVLIIGEAGKENWQASAWRLERKFPARWGKKLLQQVEHSGAVDISKRAEEIDRYFRGQTEEEEED